MWGKRKTQADAASAAVRTKSRSPSEPGQIAHLQGIPPEPPPSQDENTLEPETAAAAATREPSEPSTETAQAGAERTNDQMQQLLRSMLAPAAFGSIVALSRPLSQPSALFFDGLGMAALAALDAQTIRAGGSKASYGEKRACRSGVLGAGVQTG